MRLKIAEPGVDVHRIMLHDGAVRAINNEGVDDKRIGGIGAPWDSMTTLFEWDDVVVREKYKRGCFTNLNDGSDVRSFYNHNPDVVLGRRSNRTLRLSDTDAGLTYDVSLNGDDPDAMRVYSRVKRGDVVGASVWFRPEPDGVERNETFDEQGRRVVDRVIVRATLMECGPVTDGQYTDTTAVARAIMRSAAEASHDEFMAAITAAGGWKR